MYKVSNGWIHSFFKYISRYINLYNGVDQVKYLMVNVIILSLVTEFNSEWFYPNFSPFSLVVNRPSRWPRQPRAMLATDNTASSNFTPHWLNSAKITFSNLNVPEVILLRNQIVFQGRCATFYLYFQTFSRRKQKDKIKSLLSQYIKLMSGYILEREVHLCAAL